MGILSEEIGVGFLYILPGFLAFEICRELILLEREFKEFEAIMYSFIFSTLIYTPLAVFGGINSVEKLKESLYSIPNMLIFIISGLALGYISGRVYKMYYLKDVYKGHTWDNAFNRILEKSVNVHVLTTSGLEYQTNELIFSEGESPHELLLYDAKLIERNDDLKIICTKDLHSHIFIEGKYIQRISFQTNDTDENNLDVQ